MRGRKLIKYVLFKSSRAKRGIFSAFFFFCTLKFAKLKLSRLEDLISLILRFVHLLVGLYVLCYC